jgi:hypothetical protein
LPVIQIAQLEEWIRAGAFSKVSKALLELNTKKIPRGEKAAIANIANRADLYRFAFRLLNPVIRAGDDGGSPPSDLELIEYAEALRRMGLVNEALGIFAKLDAAKYPFVHLRAAFCLFAKWEYARAIPGLRAMLGLVKPEDYLSTIAKVNLAAALVHERQDEEALKILRELRVSTRNENRLLLLGNCLELSSQVHIARREWSDAESVLKEAEGIFSGDRTKYSRFVAKWQAIARSLKERQVHPALVASRELAVASGDWETVRDCDLYMGAINGDEALLRKVYFGTPYASFRRRILDLAKVDTTGTYLWQAEGETAAVKIFDVRAGGGLDPGRRMHQLMVLLSRDFYRPVTVGSAFSALFPEEHFRQEGSANRVSQLVLRLRRWLAQQDPGLSIEGHDGRYRLNIHPGAAIRVPETAAPADPLDIRWEKIRRRFVAAEFTRREVAVVTDCSPATAKRLLRWAVETGKAEPVGSGAQVKYKIAA